MSRPEHFDQERWPQYWAEIRRFAVVMGVTLVVGASLFTLLQPLRTTAAPWRLAIVFIVTFAAAALSDHLAAWIADRWERRLGGK